LSAARYLFLDEVDAYPPSADEEGDPVALAEARTRTFSWRSKEFYPILPKRWRVAFFWPSIKRS